MKNNNYQNNKITWEEVQKHNIEKDCWLVIRGKVYNVTNWIPKHPGGYDMIVLNGGRDATQLFEAYHSVKVNSMLDNYYIGNIISDDNYPEFPPMSEFYSTLKKKIENYFIENKLNPRPTFEMFIRTIFLLFYVLMFHYFSIISSSLIISIICAIFSGFGYALLCFMPVHEGSHASTSDSPLLWRLFGSIHDFINGASFYTWCHQHFLGHHPFTNLSSNKDNFIAIDPDIYTNEPDIRRIKPYQKWYNRYKWQHWYVPILYGFLALKYRINDLLIVFILKKNGHIRLNPLNSYHFNMFIFGKLFFLFYRIILPCFYISIEKSLLLFFISDFVTSYTLALVFQVNHVISLAKWPIIDKKTGKVNMDWAEMQLNTTVDYAHDSWFTTFFTGALNYQVVHHLFPYISQIHYPVLAPIIKKHCELYGIKYNYLPSFWHALKEHIYYLSIMGHGHADN